MREVLVFAEATPDAQQRVWLLDRLEDLRQRPVICQVHLRPARAFPGTSPVPAPVSAPLSAPVPAPVPAADAGPTHARSSGRRAGRLPAQAARSGAPGESGDPGEREERDVELARARRRLHDLVGLVRDAGHVAHGELLAGPLIRALTRGIAERSPEEVLLLTSDHRLELLLRRDLERRVRHASAVPLRVLEGSPGLPRG